MLPLLAQGSRESLSSTGVQLCGVVRADGDGEPLAGVRVTVVDEAFATETRANGGYCLRLFHGQHRVLVSRQGFAPQALTVVAGDDPDLTLDVTLVTQALPLREVRVRAFAADRSTPIRPSEPWDAEPGQRRLMPQGDPALSDADPLGSVTSAPDGVGSGPEAGAALRVRGGSADQNRILLDGVPVYLPAHLSGAMSVFSPDFVDDGLLHAGVPSARLGGGLASVVELRSRDPEPDVVTTRAGLTGGLARLSLGGPLPVGLGSFLVGGRVSARGVPGFAGDASNTTIGVRDLFGKLRVPVGAGVLEVFALSAGDQLAFATNANAGAAGAVAAADGSSSSTDVATALQPPENRFDRSSSTAAVTWSSDTSAVRRAEARVWRSTSVTSSSWLASGGALRLDHAFSSLGASAEATWRGRAGMVVVGWSAERLATRYVVSQAAAPLGAGATPRILPMPPLDAARVFASPFAEARWRPAPRWSLTVGARDELADGALSGFEPRLAVRFRASEWLSLGAAAGRVHQSMQSLDNHESIFTTFLGGALPVVSSGAVARADRLDVGADITLGAHLALMVDAYGNRFGGLAQVAPASAQPFAVEGLARASAQSSGVLFGMTYRDGRVSAQASYAYSAGSRFADGVRYDPASGGAHALSAALAYSTSENTTLRVALWAGGGRRTTLTSGDLEWASAPLVNGEDLAGGPQQWLGALGAATLPPFVRVDVGVRQAWNVRVGSRPLTLTGTASVLNVFDRADARGIFVPSAGGARRFASMLPRTLALGVEWAY
ncbi:MAG: TonB-dependent receptor [Gemmatimonadetes bacterium]|nr:TonB-dependent receptor [Gemmatimonadota bacterium]